MLRFSTQPLSNTHLAEDAVQEALVGTLKNANPFADRAVLKTCIRYDVSDRFF